MNKEYQNENKMITIW